MGEAGGWEWKKDGGVRRSAPCQGPWKAEWSLDDQDRDPVSPGEIQKQMPESGKDREPMSDGAEDQLVGFVAGLLLGAAIGATAALLSAPQSGRRTRKRLGRTARELKKNTGDRFDDVAEEVRNRVDDALQGARKRLSSG
jgi:hypothetical protein